MQISCFEAFSAVLNRNYFIITAIEEVQRTFQMPFAMITKVWTENALCLKEWGKLGNGGGPILLKIGTQSNCQDLCNIPKFQLR